MLRGADRLDLSTPVADRLELGALWRVWLPVGLAVLILVLNYTAPQWTWDVFFTEGWGILELLHLLIPLAASVIALRALFSLPRDASVALKALLSILAAGCFYIAGEEHSWGQHFFGWETPEGWAEINRQQETNLHNTSSWFNHKPRVVLNVAVILGSIVIPIALARGWMTERIERFRFVLPSRTGHVLGWLVVFYMCWDSLRKAGYLPYISPRDAEMHELFLYSYLFVYALTLSRRIDRVRGF